MSAVMLTGFMGTGKTTVGRALAARLQKPFVDTDEQVERLAGCSIAAIFATKGEAHFRALERRVVAETAQQDAVVATGGGAIVDPLNYQHMHAAGTIVCLTADVDVLVARTASDTTRPLLPAAERRARIAALLAERAGAYAQADAVIDTSQRSIAAVVEEIVSFLCHRRDRREGGES
jgi:shikimate kinase